MKLIVWSLFYFAKNLEVNGVGICIKQELFSTSDWLFEIYLYLLRFLRASQTYVKYPDGILVASRYYLTFWIWWRNMSGNPFGLCPGSRLKALTSHTLWLARVIPPLPTRGSGPTLNVIKSALDNRLYSFFPKSYSLSPKI